MAETFTSYKIENDRAFYAAIERAKKVTSDLTIPLTLIAKDFYKSEKSIFMLKGPGQYEDLKDATKEDKRRGGFSVYPILARTGRLGDSLTNPTHPDAINQIVNKRTLVIGTGVSYGVFHQSDRPRNKIPLRKFLFIGPESRFANADQQGRLGRWMNIMNAFVMKKLGA